MVTFDFREIPGIDMLNLEGSVFPDFSGEFGLYAGPSAPYDPNDMLVYDTDDGLAGIAATGFFYYSGANVLETSRVTSLKVYNNDENTDYRMYITGFNLPFFDVLGAIYDFNIMSLFAGQGLEVMGTLAYGDRLTGGNESDEIAGFGGNDSLFGSGGNDLLMGGAGVDLMNGGAGDDDYEVDQTGDSIVEDSIAGGGIDFVASTVTYTLPVNVEGLSQASAVGAVNGTGNAGANFLGGNSAANVLSGLGGNDVIQGAGGNDVLNGGTGIDTMNGGLGNDVFVSDVAGDVIQEAAGQGIDTLQSAVTRVLGSTLEHLTLTGSAHVNGTGNTLANKLTGNSGNNILNGGSGIDTMNGGLGNDVFVSDVAGDVIQEAAGQGIDTLQSAVTRVLGSTLEHLTLTGSAHVNGTGNTLANKLTGNSGNNILNGGSGADTVVGGSGKDTLVWGTGDFFDGGVDYDVLRVDGKGIAVDLVKLSNTMMKNVEAINITGSGNNTLTVSITEVLNISASSNTLRIDGNAGDIVHYGTGWVRGGVSGGYRSYSKLDAILQVDTDITAVI